jgi:hypothetical protein
MLRRMEAEVTFYNPNDVNPGTAALIEQDFDVEVLDWIDDDSPVVWIKAWANTERTEDDFFNWVEDIVGPLGFVVETNLSRPT